ncbi:hypothetical protein SASPL_129386 [Salvia splendens]|uniref:DUF7870 domain-containing protein n=1 Tax=Salvia splendens TaxID=180675 RepID=A0A8X8XCN7_SALSN|nr:uncharacterized protein LOC121750492 [Salvia splendens]KAG6411306.1 hypothetical protein SASPL_129386 [Salvia splendens]
MNPRKPNPAPSLKLIVYGMPLLFLLLTIASMFKHKPYTTTTTTLTSLRPHCNAPSSIISQLEPLIAEEPLDVWEGLGKEESHIRYLPSLTDLSRSRRFIYVDLGARDYDSSIGSWFAKQYPKQNRTFEIYAVEADASFHAQYRARRGVTLLPYAAWVRNETVVFGSRPIVVGSKVWRMRPFGRIEGEQAAADGMSAVVRVAAFDFVEWLTRNVAEEDFVVVKMDVEGTEIELVRDLVKRGAMCLIDELFMECHFDRYVKCCSGERINRFNFSYPQCYRLFKELRDMGSVVHQWW